MLRPAQLTLVVALGVLACSDRDSDAPVEVQGLGGTAGSGGGTAAGAGGAAAGSGGT